MVELDFVMSTSKNKERLKKYLTSKIKFIIILRVQLRKLLFRSSSVVELSAVNRSVAGSNPACGAIWRSTQVAEEDGLLNR